MAGGWQTNERPRKEQSRCNCPSAPLPKKKDNNGSLRRFPELPNCTFAAPMQEFFAASA